MSNFWPNILFNKVDIFLQMRFKMEIFEIKDEYIELNKLLKAAGLIDSGGMAKMVINDELVKVDGNIEIRKRRKIKNNMVIEFDNRKVKVISKK